MSVPFLNDRPDIVRATMCAVLQGLLPTLSSPQVFSDQRGTSGVAWMRQACMHVMSARLGATMEETGRAFGRDRTTVRHAVEIVEAAIGANTDTAAFIDFIEQRALARLAHLEAEEVVSGGLPGGAWL